MNSTTNSFYTYNELTQMSFKHLGGENILISRKASIYGIENISIENNVRVDDFCILSGKITIGSYVHIAAYTALYGGKTGITIEDFANLSSRICVYSVNDDYSGESMTNPMIPEKYKNVLSAPVYIGKHVTIGSTSVVLPGVNLKEGSSFGSFSFVTHDSEPWSINAGIPAKKIKDRSKALLKYETELLNSIN